MEIVHPNILIHGGLALMASSLLRLHASCFGMPFLFPHTVASLLLVDDHISALHNFQDVCACGAVCGYDQSLISTMGYVVVIQMLSAFISCLISLLTMGCDAYVSPEGVNS